MSIQKIHHITAIAGPAKVHYAFYHDLLGLTLVKQTVNFDDPSVYHFYYDTQVQVGKTVITFFPWQTDRRGRQGGGQGGRIFFYVPQGALSAWWAKLSQSGVASESKTVHGFSSLYFLDPHGQKLALIESDQPSDSLAIQGTFGMELLSRDPQQTKAFIQGKLQWKLVSEEVTSYLFANPDRSQHLLLDKTAYRQGRFGPGTVHHIAWQVEDASQVEKWRKDLVSHQTKVTEVKDRNYFKSIYMKEPGGIVYEFASKGPGFTVDEGLGQLGSQLQLPDWLEDRRIEIEASLPDFR